MTSVDPENKSISAASPTQAGAGPQAIKRLAYFAGDATNPTVRLRISQFMRNAVDVTGFTFRREKFHRDFVPFWDDISLGTTQDRHYFRRLTAIISGMMTMWRHRDKLREVDVLYSRLFDSAFLAMLMSRLLRLDAKLVYEIEDVHDIFFKQTVPAKVLRFLERRVLATADLVVLPSPGFAEGYLVPYQGYTRPYFLHENRIQLDEIPSQDAPPSPRSQVWKETQDRWVIGWFGTLRCRKSMRLLSEIAERLGDKVLIYTRGYPTETGLEEYMELVERHSNWIHEGPYLMPDDLEDLYGRVHFVWCLDFYNEDGNSELLLACRMYHGGYYGAVPLFSQQSQMASHLAPHGIGHAIADPYVDDICTLIEEMSWEGYLSEREAVLARREELFLEDGSGVRALLERIADPDEAADPGPSKSLQTHRGKRLQAQKG